MADKKKFVPQENALMMFNRFLQMAETDEQKTMILDMKQAFLELPTIEIVQCEKCKFCEHTTPVAGLPFDTCLKWLHWTKPEYSCPFGEVKSDES
jgi:hypothetical protein